MNIKLISIIVKFVILIVLNVQAKLYVGNAIKIAI